MAKTPKTTKRAAARGKHPVFEHAESIAKLATVVVGVLYVLGLLISNIQLVQLGISDFASLQTRNILTGFFFALYVILLLAVLVTLAFVVRLAWQRRPGFRVSAWPGFILGVIGSVIAVLAVVFVAGEVFGFLYPWGQPLSALVYSAISWLFSNANDPIYSVFDTLFQQADGEWRQKPLQIGTSFAQFVVAYFHIKVFVASALIILVFRHRFPILVSAVLQWWRTGRKAKRRFDWEAHFTAHGTSTRRLVFASILLGAVVLPLLMFDYAEEVYPNLSYNLGGGQPQVAELVLSGKKTDLIGMPGTEVCCGDENADKAAGNADKATSNSDKATKTGEIVIWYQSDKFIYASSLAGVGQGSKPIRPQVVAIDLKLVRGMQHAAKNVQIYSGAVIKGIYLRIPAAAVTAVPVAWAQLLPDDGAAQGRLIARTVVPPGSSCPEVTLDPPDGAGKRPMTERWPGDGPFPVKVCELEYPRSATAHVGEIVLKPPPAMLKKIVVIGDTGCRIAPWGAQDCSDAREWPFKKIADQVAKLEPDLVIHMGDYHYREACPQMTPGNCAGFPLGDNWAAWRADFFEPAAGLLTAAPWVMLRGNHEDTLRAAAGWQILLSPFARAPVGTPWPDDAQPYTLHFANLSLAILDVANEGIKGTAQARAERYVRWVDRLTHDFPGDQARPSWLFLHKPLFASTACHKPDTVTVAPCREQVSDADKGSPMNVLRSRLNGESRPRFDAIFAGDTHMFQFFAPTELATPPQIVAGMSGTLLEQKAYFDDAVLRQPVRANLFDVAGRPREQK